MHSIVTAQLTRSGKILLDGYPFYLAPLELTENAWKVLQLCDGSQTAGEIVASVSRTRLLSSREAWALLRELLERRYLYFAQSDIRGRQ